MENVNAIEGHSFIDIFDIFLVTTYIQVFAFRGQHMIDFLHKTFEKLINAIHEH